MKYKTFLNILFLIALLSTVIIMTADNVEAASDDYYTVTAKIDTLVTWVDYISANDAFTYININGVRVSTIHSIGEYWGWEPVSLAFKPLASEPFAFFFMINVSYSIDNITLGGVNGYDIIDVVTDLLPYRLQHVNASFWIHKNNELVASGHGLGTHVLNIPCPSIPCPLLPLPPPPIFELPPPPTISPPTIRPEFFNFTTLVPFFNFVDALFLPFAQVILNILWIFLGILDLINNTLITFWAFYDTHVIYEGFFNILGFAYMFFEIPEIMAIMVFGLFLIVIKIYLKR